MNLEEPELRCITVFVTLSLPPNVYIYKGKTALLNLSVPQLSLSRSYSYCIVYRSSRKKRRENAQEHRLCSKKYNNREQKDFHLLFNHRPVCTKRPGQEVRFLSFAIVLQLQFRTVLPLRAKWIHHKSNAGYRVTSNRNKDEGKLSLIYLSIYGAQQCFPVVPG